MEKKKRATPEEVLERRIKRAEELEKQHKAELARVKVLERQLKEKERKERTHRLIQLGVVVESNFGKVSEDELELFGRALGYDKEQLRSYMNAKKASSNDAPGNSETSEN